MRMCCIRCRQPLAAHLPGGHCLPVVQALSHRVAAAHRVGGLDGVSRALNRPAETQLIGAMSMERKDPALKTSVHRAVMALAKVSDLRRQGVGADDEEGYLEWAYNSAKQGLYDLATAPTRLVGHQMTLANKAIMSNLSRAQQGFRKMAQDSSGGIASIFKEQADALQEVMTNLGKGAGQGFREFFGLPPWVVWGVAVAGGLGLVFWVAKPLLLSAGGQSVLVSSGRSLTNITGAASSGLALAARKGL